MKFGRDIARGKGHLVRPFDLGTWRPFKGPTSHFCIFLPNHIFAPFSQSISVIPTKLDRDIARAKGYLVHEFDLWKGQPFYGSEITVLHFPQMYFGYSNKTW